MSEELKNQVKSLQDENANLKQQLMTNSQGVEGLLAQVDAYKSMIQDNTQISLQLRTNLVLYQKQAKQLNDKIEALNKQIVEQGQMLEEYKKQTANLEAA